MTNQTVQELNEQNQKICANIDCQMVLSGFDISNNKKFCRNCRIANKQLRWHCKKCGVIMTNERYSEKRKFCDICARRVSIQIVDEYV